MHLDGRWSPEKKMKNSANLTTSYATTRCISGLIYSVLVKILLSFRKYKIHVMLLRIIQYKGLQKS